MMRETDRDICIFSFTEQGSRMNRCLCEWIWQEGLSCQGYTIRRYAGGELKPLPDDRKAFIKERWSKSNFIFIGAAGIAVRHIAPLVKDKFSDPAVLVLDENGQYVIPLLSGHVGGAVELSDRIAGWIGATAVHTTATDVQGKFAVDTFARENDLEITDREAAKRISAAVLEGEDIALYAPECVLKPRSAAVQCSSGEGDASGQSNGSVRENGKKDVQHSGLVWCTSKEEWKSYRYRVIIEEREEETDAEPKLDESGGIGGWLKGQEQDEEKQTEASGADDRECVLRLVIKKSVVLGVGCRKGLDPHAFEQGILQILEKNQICSSQIAAIASIDLKKEEQAIVLLAEKWKVPFVTYGAEQLNEIREVSSASAFVKQTTGTDNVCERAAKRYCVEKSGTEGILIQEKTTGAGLTASIVRMPKTEKRK